MDKAARPSRPPHPTAPGRGSPLCGLQHLCSYIACTAYVSRRANVMHRSPRATTSLTPTTQAAHVGATTDRHNARDNPRRRSFPLPPSGRGERTNLIGPGGWQMRKTQSPQIGHPTQGTLIWYVLSKTATNMRTQSATSFISACRGRSGDWRLPECEKTASEARAPGLDAPKHQQAQGGRIRAKTHPMRFVKAPLPGASWPCPCRQSGPNQTSPAKLFKWNVHTLNSLPVHNREQRPLHVSSTRLPPHFRDGSAWAHN